MFTFNTTPRFDKAFKKLDPYIQKMIMAWIYRNLVNCDDPRVHGKSLKGNYEGLWRYRIGDYRIICSIEDNKMVILSLSVGHRNSVYLRESE